MTMNKYFDLMNVKEDLRLKYPNQEIAPQKLPYGAALEEQNAILLEVETLVSDMRVEGKKNCLPFQDGIIMSCRGLPLLREQIVNMFPGKKIEILTYHLNQDVLEQLFSLMRITSGTYTNPTPVDFKRRMRKVLLGRNPQILLKDKKLNVMIDATNDQDQILTFKVCYFKKKKQICNSLRPNLILAFFLFIRVMN